MLKLIANRKATVMAGILLASTLGAAPSHGASVQLQSAPLITPASAWSYYGGLTMTHTTGVAAWTTEPQEIVELSRALGASTYTQTAYATHVYEYIRNNIAIEFRFGLSKGARGALIDQSGTAFDQAHLMVELLRQDGITANYQVGTITLTAAQFTAWSGISNALAACEFLANGAIPATINGATTCSSLSASTSVTSVTMGHIWVAALSQVYDPAYKVQILESGIDLASAMGCGSASAPTCGTTLLSTSNGLIPAATPTCGISGVNCVTNVNQAGIESQLLTYARNLETYTKNYNATNGAFLQTQDLVGGLTIDVTQPVGSGSLLPASTYPASPQWSFTGNIPDPFRTKLTIQLDQINQLVYADETAGDRLRIWGYASGASGVPANLQTTATRVLTLFAEYQPIASSTLANQTYLPATLTLTVDHPYAADTGTYADGATSSLIQIMSPDCAINTVANCQTYNWRVGVVTITQGWGDQTQSTVSHYGALQSRDKLNGAPWQNVTDPRWIWFTEGKAGLCGPRLSMTGLTQQIEPSDTNPCYALQQGTLAANWLAQSARIRILVGSINSVAVQHHHSLGTVLSGDSVGTGATILSLQTAVSTTSESGNTTDPMAAFVSISAAEGRLEGGVEEQAFGAWEGGSGPSLMARSNANQIPFLDVNSTNISAVSSYLLQTASDNWTSWDIASIASYANANPGYSVVVPLNGFAGSFPSPNGVTLSYTGTGFAAFGSQNTGAAFVATVGFSYALGGGGAPTNDPANQAQESAKIADYGVKKRSSYSVDLSGGDLQLKPAPDLVTGVGKFPYSLSYQRVYSAGAIDVSLAPVASSFDYFPTELDPSGIGGGWTHTLAIQAQIQSDPFAGMGRDSGLSASSIIAGLYVQRTLQLGTVDIRSRLATIFTTHWLINSLNRNVVVVSRPPSRNTFVQLPDNSFDPGPGSAEILTQTGSEIFFGWNNAWEWTGASVVFTLLPKDGSTMTFTQSLGTAYPGFLAPFNFPFVLQTWKFPTGINLAFTYTTVNTGYWGSFGACLTQVSNNLGRSLTFNDPCIPTGNVTVGAQSIKDDGGRTVTLTSMDAGGAHSGYNFASSFPPTAFYVTGADGGITEYDYTYTPTSTANRPFAGINQWLTPGDRTNPYVTVTYDTLFRVSAITDNSVPTHFTTQYYVAGLYATQNQKRTDVIDPLSAITTSYFDEWNRNTQTIDAIGRVTSHTYDPSRRLLKTTFPELNTDTFAYDVRSNLLSTIHTPKPGSSLAATTEAKSYEEAPNLMVCVNRATCNQPATATDANHNVTSYSYLTGGTGQLERTTGPTVAAQTGGVSGNAQTDFCYLNVSGSDNASISLLGGIVDKVDASTNRVRSFAYNTLANHFVLQSSTIDPSNSYAPPSSAGGPCANTTKSTGALNLVTGYAFDLVGNVQAIDGPIPGPSDVTSYTFDAMRRLTTVAAPLSVLTRYCYDADGELTSTNRARIAGLNDPNSGSATTNGQCSSFPSTWMGEQKTYLPTGDLQTVVDAAGHTTQYAYDPDGRQQVIQDPDGRQTARVYDLVGEVIAEWRGGTGWISSTGFPSSTAPTAATLWTPTSYLGIGPLRYQSYCNGSTCYSANGKPLYAVDAGNHVTQYQYDGLDRLKFTYFPDPNSGALCAAAVNDAGAPSCTGLETYEKAAFDSVGNRTALTTRKGDLISFHFDTMNRQDGKSPAAQGTVTTGLDLTGEPYQISKAAYGSNSAHTTSYTYDADGRVLLESNDSLTVSHQYDTLVSTNDNAGNRTRTIWPDSYFVTYQYDALNRMVDVRENSTSTNELAYYTYDTLSRRTVDCLGGGTTGACQAGTWTNTASYGYEALDGQLNALTLQLNGTNVSLNYSRNNSYQLTGFTANDAFYLPVPAAGDLIAYAPNALNQYGSVAGQTSNYDADGNLLSWYPISGAQTYQYDSENRLVTAAVDGSTVSYDYDGLGRRISKTVSSSPTSYLLDGDEEIAEYGGSTLLRRYITGSSVDERIAHVEIISGASYKTFYHVNHQGSVVALSDSTGNVSGCATNISCQRLAYDEYGNLTAAAASKGEPFRYTGRRYDPETGLYYYRARYYAPQLGRFLQVDPVGYKDNLDLYTYTGNDPLNGTDPTGEDDEAIEEITVTGIRPPPPPPPPPPGIVKPSPVSVPIPRLTIPRVTALSLFQEFLLGGCGDSYGSPSCQDGNTMSAKDKGDKPSDKSRQSKPTNAPPGTKPIDQTGRSKDEIHGIKDGIVAGPKDWVGITPGGDVITTNPDGTAENHGPASNYTN